MRLQAGREGNERSCDYDRHGHGGNVIPVQLYSKNREILKTFMASILSKCGRILK